MKTDELISLLATQIESVDSRRLRRQSRVILAGGCLTSLVICAAVLKINPTLSHIVMEPMFWGREFFCVTLGVTGILAVARLGSPGRKMGFLPVGFLLPVFVLWSLAAVALLSSPSHERLAHPRSDRARMPLSDRPARSASTHRVHWHITGSSAHPSTDDGRRCGIRRRLARGGRLYASLSGIGGAIYRRLVLERDLAFDGVGRADWSAIAPLVNSANNHARHLESATSGLTLSDLYH